MSFLATPSGFQLFLATLPLFAKTGKGARGYATISLRGKHQDFPPKCHLRSGHRGRLLHNEQFAPFYGNLPLAKRHIFMHGLAGLRYRNTGCSDARCFAAYPYAFSGVSSE